MVGSVFIILIFFLAKKEEFVVKTTFAFNKIKHFKALWCEITNTNEVSRKNPHLR